MNQLFNFIVENKMSLYKIFLVISFIFVFVKPVYGFALFAASITLLAYSDAIKEYFDGE